MTWMICLNVWEVFLFKQQSLYLFSWEESFYAGNKAYVRSAHAPATVPETKSLDA